MRHVLSALALVLLSGCGFFGRAQQPTHFYTLAMDPLDESTANHVSGLVRVANMDTTSTYDKFQIVIRESPYQLIYSDLHVWAVKPGRMVSDVVALGLRNASVFDAVTRELSDRRPDYTIAGELNAIEIYNSDNMWFAHLAISFTLTRFTDGQVLWSYAFDKRKQVPTDKFETSIRGVSELLSSCVEEAVGSLAIAMQNVPPVTTGARLATPILPPTPPPPPARERRDIDAAPDSIKEDIVVPQQPVIIPEKRKSPHS
jgi:ABC-type uncharacterized transport system auxiliary subunit